MFHYGINSKLQIGALADMVCDLLGHGAHYTAYDLLMETAAAETQLGQYKDPTPNGAGWGLTQFDPIGFEDVQTRTRKKDKDTIKKSLGIDIDQAKIEDLADDPLLAFVFTRLKYKLRPEPIPESLFDRAAYWKKFYNTEAGKGTTEHYIASAQRHLGATRNV